MEYFYCSKLPLERISLRILLYLLDILLQLFDSGFLGNNIIVSLVIINLEIPLHSF